MNKNVEKVVSEFLKSIEDDSLIKSEKRSIQGLIEEFKLNDQELAFLRSKIFDIAKEKANSENYMKIINWLESANKTTMKNNISGSSNEVYFSPGVECQNAIINFISSAKKSLKICVFTISNNDISDAIITAYKRNIEIKIITDNHKLEDYGSDIDKFVSEGIDIRIDNTEYHMHHKFALVDNKKVLTGSFNWTRSATLYNNENILITDDLSSIRKFNSYFDSLWTKMTEYK